MARESQLPSLSDDELLRRLSKILNQSRRVEAVLVEHIGEVDHRRLFRREACSSMFTYCTEVLHLSEAEAYLRINVARACRSHPKLLEMLADGRLHLRGIITVAPHLTVENRADVLERAAHKSKRQLEVLVAELSPKPDVPATIRKLPRRPSRVEPVAEATSNGNAQICPGRVPEPRRVAVGPTPKTHASPAPKPLSPSRFKVQFTASVELRDKLQRLTEMVQSSSPEATLADVIDAAVTEKLARLEAKRFAKTSAPRRSLEQTDTSPASRYIPAAVRRAVHERDGGRCAFVGPNGRRCTERNRLELHHVKPFARGGTHEPDNVSLLCRSHNRYRAECDYGRDVMDQYRTDPDRIREPAPVYFVDPRPALRMAASSMGVRIPPSVPSATTSP